MVVVCRTEVMLLKMPPMRKLCRGCRFVQAVAVSHGLGGGAAAVQGALLLPSYSERPAL